ncbi:hypothetical protein Gpo141_00013805 [Globisporangium polare]
MATANCVALQVLGDRSLLKFIAAFSTGVPYFAFQVKQKLVCATDAYEPGVPASDDIALWQNAVCAGDRKTLHALQLLAAPPSSLVGVRIRNMLYGILSYATTHTKDLELLDWIDDNFDAKITGSPMTDEGGRPLGEQGDVEIVKWAISRGHKPAPTIAYGAASKGHWDLLEFMYRRQDVVFYCDEAMSEAASNDHIFVVRDILYDEHGYCNHGATSAICDAAANGHLRIVTYLYNNVGCTWDLSDATDRAATNGHLEIVQFLHANRENSSGRAMDGAVRNRRFDVIKYLHENDFEGCTAQAMVDAIRDDDFETLKLLCEYRGEESVEEALEFVVKRGELKMIKMLCEALPEDFTPSLASEDELVRIAARGGNLEAIQYFHESKRFPFTPEVMHGAAVKDHLDVVEFLHEHRTEGCKVNTLFECDENWQLRTLEFLCVSCPMKNPADAIARAKREGREKLAARLEKCALTATKAYEYE